MNGNRQPFIGKCFSFSALLLIPFLAACTARPTSLTVPLQYSPNNTLSNAITLPQGQGKIYILPVDDERPDKTRIGENREDPNAVIPIVAGLPDVPDWVHKTFADVLHGDGLPTVGSAYEADRLLNISLTNFWAKEDSSYDAQITAVIKVMDKNGAVLFTGTISGQDNLTGKGLDVENYRQILSNSMYSAIDRLLNNTAFQQSLVIAPAVPQPPQPGH